MLSRLLCLFTLLSSGIASSSLAAETGPYHLFNPVPADQMRELSTDRPDTTESPYTVPGGHFQLEASFFDYTRDLDRGVRSQTWIYGQMNFKLGLAPDVDLQVVLDSHTQTRTTDGDDLLAKASGFNDVTVRLKTNLWGNDGGKTAFALMPFVSIPTGSDVSSEEWQGGLILPFAVSLSDRLGLGFMLEGDLVPDAETGGYDLEWVHSVTLGISLTERLGMYVELVGIAGEDTAYLALFDCGISVQVAKDLVWDAGVRLGLNRAAEDIGVFTGMSVRF